ncbi:transcription factor grauzone-like [Musca vetustissima]|uniref:transcription factor grauzone-like n=1 Tax=Musca vetustissima TaxID=27455 RepID=UPI002AB5E936|nr:transcription factor grauzone-like [Musca vetustissima]
MDMCLLCLELKPDLIDGIKVTSQQWHDENIEAILEKHFWCLKSITSTSWLCNTCWKIVYDFHKFYLHIEDVHTYFVSALKTEVFENNENPEPFITNHEENSSSKMMVTIETRTSAETTTQEMDIFPEIKSENVIEEPPITIVDTEMPYKPEEINEDPLEKSLPTGKKRGRRKANKTNNDDKEDTAATKETSPSPTRLDGDLPSEKSSSSDSESDSEDSGGGQQKSREYKPRLNPYYKPRTKRKEVNEFLAKHYKISCIICQAPMHSFNELCKHFNKQHNEPGYVVCCNKKFLKCSLLADHIHCHLDPDYFKCQHCGKVMSDRRSLELHVKTHGIQDKIHICDICQKGFSRKPGLKIHKLIHLSDEEKKFSCEQCGKLFGNHNLLANHVRVVHQNKYALVCDVCGEKMRGKDVFERHMLKHKGVPIPTIACDVCGLKVTGQRGLKRHKDSQHPEGGKQQFPCHICSQISPTLKAHKKHVKDKHELGYDFKCTLCEKAYKRASTLKEHMATHTGTVLYTCQYCPKTFNSNANMHSHRKKAHPKEWEEDCRAKYSGNLPPKYKLGKTNNVTNEGQSENTTIKWS